MICRGIAILSLSKDGIFGFRDLWLACAVIFRCLIISRTLIRPVTPAVASVWPTLPLMEPKWRRESLWGPPKASRILRTSIGSPTPAIRICQSMLK